MKTKLAKILSPVIAVVMVIALMFAVLPAYAADVFKVAAASLELKNDISVKYYVSVPDSYTDLAAEFTLNGNTTTVTSYTVSGSYKIFIFSNLAPQYMSDTITTVVRAKNNGADVVTDANSYSIKTYCANQLKKADAADELKRLCVDLLNYGAASQVYTNHNTSNLANKDLTPAQAAYGTSSSREYETVQALTGKNGAASIAAASLYLAKSIDISIYITASSMDGLKLTVYKDGAVVDEITSFTTSGNYKIAYFKKLNPSNLSDTYEFVVTNASGAEVSKKLTYSVESYAKSKFGGDDANLSALVEAMMRYGDSAYFYVNGKEIGAGDGLILSTDDPANNAAMVINYTDLFK